MSHTITITDAGGTARVDIIEQRVDRVQNPRTGDWIELPYNHAESMSLGDHRLDDPTKGGEPVYDFDAFHARALEKLTPLIGTDLAPFIAYAAAETAKIEAARVAATESIKAAVAAAGVTDAQASPAPADVR